MSIAIKDDTVYGIGTNMWIYKQTFCAMSTSSSWVLVQAGDVASNETVRCILEWT